MTNDDKADLRDYIRNRAGYDNQHIADMCNCTVATVKRYRKALASRPPVHPVTRKRN